LIAFRRKHGGDPNKHEWNDYYRRTLNKAMTGKTAELRADYAKQLEEGKPLPEDVINDATECLAIVSKRLSVTITKVRKVLGSPNRYEIEAEGVWVKIGVIRNMTDQAKFRDAVVDTIRKMLKPQKGDVWRKIVELMLRQPEIVDPGPNATDSGRVEGWLRDHLSNVFDEEEWNNALLTKKPVVKGDRIFFNFSEFKKGVRRYQGEHIPQTDLAQELSLINGLKHEGPKNYFGKDGKRSTRQLHSVPKSFLE
jgi:hypothetical protein